MRTVGEAGRVSSTDGPFFDDFSPGDVLEPAPPIHLDAAAVETYDLICDDRLPLPRSTELTRRVTGEAPTLVNPALVMHMAIGQSTVATRQVIANLFYRGVRLRRHLRVGQTISTRVEIRALSEATRRPDRPPRGKVLLGITTIDDTGEVVVEFERCALLPFRDAESGDTGHHDDVGGPESDLDLATWSRWVPEGWDLSPLGDPVRWALQEARTDPAPRIVHHCLDLVDLTRNQALAHRDPAHGQGGRRLVYGGHTIGLAQTSLTTMLPNLAAVLGWHSCDHLGPVFEGDSLSTTATLVDEMESSGGRLMAFRVIVSATRAEISEQPTAVLDWRPVVYGP